MTSPTAVPPPFNFGERLGIFIIVEASSLSTLAVLILLGYVFYRKQRVRKLRRKWVADPDNEEVPPDFDAADSSFFLNLMLAELIQAVGGLLNIRWIVEAAVTEGALCTTQGIIKQVGDVAVALTSLAIALQTFSVLALRKQPSIFVTRICIAFIWIFILLVVSISVGVHRKERYIGNTDYWCWIRENFKTERIVFEYLWMWLAAFVMIILYGLLALLMRGILFQRPGSNTNPANTAELLADADEERISKGIANLMLFYPLVYIICVFPIAVVRWLKFSGHSVPPSATIFASILFSLSGLFNVLLYKHTRPELVGIPVPSTPTEKYSSLATTSPQTSHVPLRRGTAQSSLSNSTTTPIRRTVYSTHGRLPDMGGPISEEPHEMGGLGRLPDRDDDGRTPAGMVIHDAYASRNLGA